MCFRPLFEAEKITVSFTCPPMNRLFSLTARRLATPIVVTSTFLSTSPSTQAEEESDPYANLPEEDERTTCTICLVNRQGPCREPWRKFELCLKNRPLKNDDKGGENDQAPDAEHSSAFCDRYMLPWLSCVQSYRNMYTLYFNYLNQLELIEPIEKEIRKDELCEWKEVDVDWTPYVDWVKSKGYTLWELSDMLTLTAPPITPRPKFEGQDPEMVEVEVKITLEEGGLPIRIAYAKDQGGGLLGMEHFGDAKEEGSKDGVLKISFRPGMTSHIQFYAFYKNEADEARLLCSDPVPLVMVAMEAGGIPMGKGF